jgi:hypothetical protein
VIMFLKVEIQELDRISIIFSSIMYFTALTHANLNKIITIVFWHELLIFVFNFLMMLRAIDLFFS